MYRPTVRFDDSYKELVDNLFYTTYLDRNQIHRLGLFLLCHTMKGRRILNQYKKSGMQLPIPSWTENDHGAWLERKWDKEKETTDTKTEGPTLENQSKGEGKVTLNLFNVLPSK